MKLVALRQGSRQIYDNPSKLRKFPLKSVFNLNVYIEVLGFSGGTEVKKLPANAGDIRDMGSIPE